VTGLTSPPQESCSVGVKALPFETELHIPPQVAARLPAEALAKTGSFF